MLQLVWKIEATLIARKISSTSNISKNGSKIFFGVLYENYRYHYLQESRSLEHSLELGKFFEIALRMK
jgi:hypothetical protein